MLGAARERQWFFQLFQTLHFFTPTAKLDFSTEKTHQETVPSWPGPPWQTFCPVPAARSSPPSLHPQQKAKMQNSMASGSKLLSCLDKRCLGGGLPDLPALAGGARPSLGTFISPRFLSRITLTLAVASALSNRTSHDKAPGSNTLARLGEIAVLLPATGLEVPAPSPLPKLPQTPFPWGPRLGTPPRAQLMAQPASPNTYFVGGDWGRCSKTRTAGFTPLRSRRHLEPTPAALVSGEAAVTEWPLHS